MGLNITDLPEHVQKQIADRQKEGATPQPVKPEKRLKAQIRLPKNKGPNKTEARYGELLRQEYPLCEVRYEEIAFKLLGGSYSPDWSVWMGPTLILVVETKGPHRFNSAGRSHMAFKAARAAWPNIRFRFAQFKAGQWAIAE